MFTIKYNDSNPQDILKHANQLKNKTLNDYLYSTGNSYKLNNRNKGSLGILVEELFFRYKPNSIKDADFSDAGVELKVAPLKKSKNKIVAKERLVLSMINYESIVNETWLNNTLSKKFAKLLLMFYLYEKDKNILDYIFKLIDLWSPSNEDLKIIEKDWNTIVNKVKEGKAHELSEGDTSFLGACTKASNSNVTRKQPYNDIPAKPRAFSLKQSYVTTIFEELSGKHLKSLSKFGDFESIVIENFNKLTGKSINLIAKENNIAPNRKPKNFLNQFMLKVQKKLFQEELKNISEFKKSGIEVKCIVLQPNEKPKEAMSFQQIKYKEIVTQDWENSEIKEKFENEKHLWLVFKTTKNYERQKELSLDEIIFTKAMFWNMPASDLDYSMKKLWQDTVNKISSGNYDNFCKSSENPVGHIRPKGRNAKDLIETPQGTLEKRKCFWLNTTYISEQIKLSN